jgi:sec-independent protein translocase protein TatC
VAEPAQSQDASPNQGTRKLRVPRTRRSVNPEARMPLLEHIRELRNRVLKALLVIFLGAVLGWFLYPHALAFIQRPYCRLRLPAVSYDVAGHQAHSCALYVTGLFDALFLRLKLAIIIGVIVSAPLWMYQLWAFVAPGLHRRERRWAYFFAGSAIPLFAIGGLFAYIAMTKGLRFLLGVVPTGVHPIITLDNYIGYATMMLLIFGLAFELPLVMVLLNVAGVLTHKRFVKWRRVIIFGVFAFAAVATPSPDPISMLLLALPCVVLVELAEVFAWLHDRRKARSGVAYPGLTPDEVAEYGLDADPLVAAHDADAGRAEG